MVIHHPLTPYPGHLGLFCRLCQMVLTFLSLHLYKSDTKSCKYSKHNTYKHTNIQLIIYQLMVIYHPLTPFPGPLGLLCRLCQMVLTFLSLHLYKSDTKSCKYLKHNTYKHTNIQLIIYQLMVIYHPLTQSPGHLGLFCRLWQMVLTFSGPTFPSFRPVH